MAIPFSRKKEIDLRRFQESIHSYIEEREIFDTEIDEEESQLIKSIYNLVKELNKEENPLKSFKLTAKEKIKTSTISTEKELWNRAVGWATRAAR